MEHRRALRASDMDVVGSLFGIRFVEMGKANEIPCAELYIEDDDWYHFKCYFNVVWLGDLARVSKDAHESRRRFYERRESSLKMKKVGIALKGFKLKDGRIVRNEKVYAVNVQLKRRGSKRVRVGRKSP